MCNRLIYISLQSLVLNDLQSDWTFYKAAGSGADADRAAEQPADGEYGDLDTGAHTIEHQEWTGRRLLRTAAAAHTPRPTGIGGSIRNLRRSPTNVAYDQVF
jgi:hypothetical protein